MGQVRRWLRRNVEWFRPPSIEPGHVYVCRPTGERFTVKSVGRQVLIERHDAELQDEQSIPKGVMRRARKHDLVEHDTQSCGKCRDV